MQNHYEYVMNRLQQAIEADYTDDSRASWLESLMDYYNDFISSRIDKLYCRKRDNFWDRRAFESYIINTSFIELMNYILSDPDGCVLMQIDSFWDDLALAFGKCKEGTPLYVNLELTMLMVEDLTGYLYIVSGIPI